MGESSKRPPRRSLRFKLSDHVYLNFAVWTDGRNPNEDFIKLQVSEMKSEGWDNKEVARIRRTDLGDYVEEFKPRM